jgi:hypothetical protein
VPPEDANEPGDEVLANVDRDRLHLTLTPTELDIIVDALRSVGNIELAERFERVLRQFGKRSRRRQKS